MRAGGGRRIRSLYAKESVAGSVPDIGAESGDTCTWRGVLISEKEKPRCFSWDTRTPLYLLLSLAWATPMARFG